MKLKHKVTFVILLWYYTCSQHALTHEPCSINVYDTTHELISFWSQFSDVVDDPQYRSGLASDAIMERTLSPEQHKHDGTAGVCTYMYMYV